MGQLQIVCTLYYDPAVLPKRGYIYGFQPNLLTEFDASGPYKIQFMASYLDLCTPVPPANIQGAIPYQTEDTRLKHACLFLTNNSLTLTIVQGEIE